MVGDILHANYETPNWYSEPAVTELEDALEEALRVIARALRDSITWRRRRPASIFPPGSARCSRRRSTRRW